MLDISTIFTNYLGSFPNFLAKDSSGAFTTDGTEFISELVNDYMWGWSQALLDYTGQTPNGILEAPGNSQILEALRRAFSFPGEIFAAAWNEDPSLLGIRAIKLIGQGILRISYPELDNAVYCGDGNNGTASAFYHADDAAGTIRNTAGIYLILPDARGQVIRSLDLAGVIDPDGPSRDLGSIQGFAIENFTGSLEFVARSDGTPMAGNGLGVLDYVNGIAITDTVTRSPTTQQTDTMTFDASGDATTSTETRMTNIAFDLFIRY